MNWGVLLFFLMLDVHAMKKAEEEVDFNPRAQLSVAVRPRHSESVNAKKRKRVTISTAALEPAIAHKNDSNAELARQLQKTNEELLAVKKELEEQKKEVSACKSELQTIYAVSFENHKYLGQVAPMLEKVAEYICAHVDRRLILHAAAHDLFPELDSKRDPA